MTIARFSEDTDAKWIIGLVVFSLILVVGWLASTGTPSETSKSEPAVTHQP